MLMSVHYVSCLVDYSAGSCVPACRDLSGRGQDGWIRLQQAAADDDRQEQAGERKKPTEDEQVQLALNLPQDEAAASCAVPWVV